MEDNKNKLGNTHEVRTVNILDLQTRAEGTAGNQIVGYAAVYDEFTKIIDRWGDTFQEKITRDAAKALLEDGHEIFALKNHNWDMVLGRTGANLTLKNDEKGIYFELEPNNSTLANDLNRIIKEIEIFEITLTPIPAYTSTSAEVRSLNFAQNDDTEAKENNSTEDLEVRKLILDVNKILK